MTVLSPRPSPAASTAEDRIIYGAVHLDVSAREPALAFWSGLVGLVLLSERDNELHLGVEGRELVVLHHGASGASPRGHSGLYHVALHLASEAEFARALLRLAEAQEPQAPTDHIMHWATYLWDPDGIGVELSFETLDRFRGYTNVSGHPMILDSDGRLRRGTDHLDLEEVLSHRDGEALGAPLAPATRVGHVHLHVGDVDAAHSFYRDGVGFVANSNEPSIGMADMRAGGSFPHRLALNAWAGAGAPQRPAGTAGLRHFELQLRGQDALAQARERLEDDGVAVTPSGDAGVFTHDPSGNALLLSSV